jgi:putative glutamine amidotransferase
MPKLATWTRRSDEGLFHPVVELHIEIQIENAYRRHVLLSEMDGLLLTGGPDISPEFLHQPVPDPSVLDKNMHPDRDRWEFEAVEIALEHGVPILAICKGMQLLNVALGGTLKLDIPGHRGPEMRDDNVQTLRTDRRATHRYAKVNSSHHQAIDQLADHCEVEAWCAADGIIEQFRLRDHPFALAVQYHPERDGKTYNRLFQDFFAQVKQRNSRGHSIHARKRPRRRAHGHADPVARL